MMKVEAPSEENVRNGKEIFRCDSDKGLMANFLLYYCN